MSSENRAQIGADLLEIDDDGVEIQMQVFDGPARMKLALQTLRDFPTYQTCERLLAAFSSLHDVVSGQGFRVLMLSRAVSKAIALEAVCQIHFSDIHIYSRNIQKK